ncbi:MAG: N-acetylmuramoyl-L-alanine amidase [Candidatus Nanoarchaeia archaeon]|nr:N-acetylmuramoyl-L-alanine amidase [Candidatus Nanoarchaeia archaeon]MDD5587899.1 N-acetylmuramoyl-L-alanine amidase [Candidatus Nanoarchaeia archaeon]
MKKGEIWTLENLAYLILGAAITFALIKFILMLLNILTPVPACMDLQSTSSLDNFLQSVKDTSTGSSVIAFGKKQCIFVGFNKENPSLTITYPDIKSSEISGKSKVCICQLSRTKEGISCTNNIYCGKEELDDVLSNVNEVKFAYSEKPFFTTDKDESFKTIYFKKEAGLLIVSEKELDTELQNVDEENLNTITAPTQYESFIQAAHNQYPNVPVGLIKGIIKKESDYVPDVVSSSGAVGLMQLKSGTARDQGLNVPEYAPGNCVNTVDTCSTLTDERFDPEKNILGGTKYLSFLLKKYGDIELAIAAYNAGPGTVDAAKGIPNTQTQDYVSKTLLYKSEYETQQVPTEVFESTPTNCEKIEPLLGRTISLNTNYYDRPEIKRGAYRCKNQVNLIVLHHTGGYSFKDTYNSFVSTGLSVHYVIDKDGIIYYLVPENQVANHAKNYNTRSIGIEIVNSGYAKDQYTEAQYNSINALINDITSRYGFPKDNVHIKAHYQISSIGKWDPSPNFSWAKIGLPNHQTYVAMVSSCGGMGTWGYNCNQLTNIA